MEFIRKYIDKRIIVLIFLIGFLLYTNHRVGWLTRDEKVKDYILNHVHTNYTYIKLESIRKAPIGEPNYDPYLGPKDGSFYRFFSIYKYEPGTVPADENFMILGYVRANGGIKIYYTGKANIAFL